MVSSMTNTTNTDAAKVLRMILETDGVTFTSPVAAFLTGAASALDHAPAPAPLPERHYGGTFLVG